MTLLDSDAIEEVVATAMRLLSAKQESPPSVTKSQFRTFMAEIDAELDSAEVSLVAALPTGPKRSWLISNASLGRELMEIVLDKRREVL